MLGTTKETDHQDSGVLPDTGVLRVAHQYRRKLDSGSLENTANHSSYHSCHHHYVPHLETQEE